MLMRRMRELYEHYLRLPRLPFVALSLVFMLLIAVLLGLMYSLTCPWCGDRADPKYALNEIGMSRFLVVAVFAVVVAPLTETLVFQYLPHKLFKWLELDVLWLCAMLSGVLFMAAHDGGHTKLIHMICMGLVLYLLYAERLRVGASNPYLDISLLHSARNLVAVVALALW